MMPKRILSLFRNLFRKAEVEQALDDELRSSLEVLTQEKIGQGLSRPEAWRKALIELGGIEQVKEEVRRIRAGHILENVVGDTRLAVRILAKRLSFTAAAILTLALGIGATTAMFCVVDAVLLRPLPYREPGRLVSFFSVIRGFARNLPAPGDYAYWRTETNIFEGVAADDSRSYTLTGDGNEAEQLGVEAVSPDLFPLLGVTPLLGRVFGPPEDKPGADHVVLISYRLWQGKFGADPSLVGRSIVLNGEKWIVHGVMRPGFAFPFATTEAWIPIDLTPEQLNDLGDHYLNEVVGRLRPGVTEEQANADLLLVSQRMAREHPVPSGGGAKERFFVEPLRATYTRDARYGLLLLMAAVTFILFIACANVASLLLSQIEQRQHEIVVRAALGAGRARIFSQLLTESAVLAVAGCVVGVLLAESSLGFLKALIPADLVQSMPLTLDLRVLCFLAIVLFVSTLFFGSAPGVRALRVDLNEILKQAPSRALTTSRPRLGEIFVVAEVALCIILLIGAGLLLESFWKLHFLDPGFQSDHVVTLSLVTPTTKRFVGFNQRRQVFDRILERVKALPGVAAAAFTSAVPLSLSDGGMIGTLPFIPEGARLQQGVESAQDRVITPDYFKVLHISLDRGRFFDENDGTNAQPVAIVNETMARTYWPNEDAIDKRFKFASALPTPWIRIVGVVRDVRQMGLDRPPQPEMYFPYRQARGNYMVMQDLVVRTTGSVSVLGNSVRHLVSSIDSTQPVSSVTSMSERLDQNIAPRRLRAYLLAALAGIALTLACVGIYGVMMYSVTQRMHEIGIRAALGATPRDLFRTVLGRGVTLTLLGICAGLAGCAASGKLIEGLLFGVKRSDPLTLAGAIVLLAVVAIVACCVPARRAAKIDPVVALRSE